MISLYTGTPGSGKSLHCAKVIYDKLRYHHNVIANFDINLDVFGKRKIGNFVYVDNFDLTPSFLQDWALKNHPRNNRGHIPESQTTVIIDECAVLFNSRDWGARDRAQWCTFFQQHRKYGYDVILITQFDRLIDRQIRSVVEYQIIHRKVSNYKFFGALLGLFCRGNLFVAVTEWYGIRSKISSEWFFGRKRYMRLYDSYRLFSCDGGGRQGDPPSQSDSRSC